LTNKIKGFAIVVAFHFVFIKKVVGGWVEKHFKAGGVKVGETERSAKLIVFKMY
jgi:hypothetical protein